VGTLKSHLIVVVGLIVTVLSAASVSAANVPPTDKVSFYFAAHEDDWQLFMNPSAFQDVAGNAAKTVFIHLTAGDAGLGVGTGGRHYPFYLAREHGAEQAILFMANADDSPAEKKVTRAFFNGHPIYRMGYRNTVGYFLRLPDGNALGTGYSETGFQSLRRLNTGEINKLAAIDASTEYHGWNDLVKTIRAIIDFERSVAAHVQINTAELDSHINPSDHSDHLMTAQMASDAVKDLPCVRRVSYVDYASAQLPANLNAQQRDMESSVFAVTLAGVLAFDHRTAWHHYDDAFIGRNYFRVLEPRDLCRIPTADLAARAR
jgi:hypothetical protein